MANCTDLRSPMITTEEITARYELLQSWLKDIIPNEVYEITLLAGDASFRRYYRLHFQDRTLIAMDAPPVLEDSRAFIVLTDIFTQLGLSVPKLIATNVDNGFLLLSDLGDNLYFQALNTENFQQLYNNAIEKLLILQQCSRQSSWDFPIFDQTLFHTELSRFNEWYLIKYLHLKLTVTEEKILAKLFENLIQSVLNQPQVCVHRDYHSRNLFALPDNQVGIIDFQDALWGPVTYDLVSLLRDCYIFWPQKDILRLANSFYSQATINGYSQEQFLRDFDWMGIQRHLKASYIFARKWCRDANSNYLNDIPRTLNYVYEACKNYPELTDFKLFMEEKILHRFEEFN